MMRTKELGLFICMTITFALFFNLPPSHAKTILLTKKEMRTGYIPAFGTKREGLLFAYFPKDFGFIVTNGKVEGQYGEQNSYGGAIWMEPLEGSKINVIWQWKDTKTGNKTIELLTLDQNKQKILKRQKINQGVDALYPLHAIRLTKGQYFVAWIDERDPKCRAFYYSCSEKGKGFFKDRNPFPNFCVSNFNILADTSGRIHCFFMANEASKNGPAALWYSSTSDLTNWSKPTKIISYTHNWLPSDISPYLTKDYIGVFTWGRLGVKLAFARTQKAKDPSAWKSGFVKGTKDLSVGRVSLVIDENTNEIHFACDIEDTEKKTKPKIYLLTSVDGGESWSDPKLISHNLSSTKALFPYLIKLEGDNLFVVWEDYRLIRGNIYGNFSRDLGNHWLPQDINLSSCPGHFNERIPFLLKGKEKTYLLYPRYKTDKLIQLEFVASEVKLP